MVPRSGRRGRLLPGRAARPAAAGQRPARRARRCGPRAGDRPSGRDPSGSAHLPPAHVASTPPRGDHRRGAGRGAGPRSTAGTRRSSTGPSTDRGSRRVRSPRSRRWRWRAVRPVWRPARAGWPGRRGHATCWPSWPSAGSRRRPSPAERPGRRHRPVPPRSGGDLPDGAVESTVRPRRLHPPMSPMRVDRLLCVRTLSLIVALRSRVVTESVGRSTYASVVLGGSGPPGRGMTGRQELRCPHWMRPRSTD